MPRRDSADTAITGGFWRSLRRAIPAISSRSGSAMSHLLTAMTVAQLRRVASVQIYDHVEALEYSQAHHLSAMMLVFSFLVLLALYAWRPNPKKGA